MLDAHSSDALHTLSTRYETCSDINHVGRAKVYAFRGKYRHYFLRITPEGGIECSQANLVVASDLTLELFVEEVRSPPRILLFLTADRRA